MDKLDREPGRRTLAFFLLPICLLLATGWLVGSGGPSSHAQIISNNMQYLPILGKWLCVTEEIEPNNTRREAVAAMNEPCFNRAVSGVMATPFDGRDVYIVSLAQESGIVIQVNDIPPGADFDVALYDPQNRAVAFSTNRGNQSERIFIAGGLQAGQYAVMVYSHTGYSSEPYQLYLALP